VLTGTPAKDSIFGADGNDELFGLGGDDYVDGESGNDIVFADVIDVVAATCESVRR
jgi:Ca2+-binding RTX toxin-like protein